MRDTLNTTVLQTKITRKTEILDFIYDESGRPFALIYTNGAADPITYYYVLNLQGDVVALTDDSGAIVAEYVYNAWGEKLHILDSDGNEITSSSNIAIINPLRYRGYYYDTETGFYYLQSRYYDPVTHRFINADSYASTDSTDAIACNMFAYCSNNPTGYIDDGGEKKVAIIYDNTMGDNAYLAEYATVLKAGYERNDDTVTMIPVTTTDELIDAWNGLGYLEYDSVSIIVHGGTGILACNGCIGSNERYNPVASFDVLDEIRIKDGITLYSCNGGTDFPGGSVAQILVKKAKTNVTAVTNSKNYFSKSGNICWGPNLFKGRWWEFCYFPDSVQRGPNRRVEK